MKKIFLMCLLISACAKGPSSPTLMTEYIPPEKTNVHFNKIVNCPQSIDANILPYRISPISDKIEWQDYLIRYSYISWDNGQLLTEAYVHFNNKIYSVADLKINEIIVHVEQLNFKFKLIEDRLNIEVYEDLNSILIKEFKNTVPCAINNY